MKIKQINAFRLDHYLDNLIAEELSLKNKTNMEKENLKKIIKEAIKETENPWKLAFFSLLAFFSFVFIILGMSQPFL